MPTLDPFAGAASESEDQKRGLLDAIAAGGVAGKEAYQTAQKEVGTYRQGALDRASTRAQMTGQNLGGADTAPVTEAADRFGTYFAGQQGAAQSQLDQIGASGTSYLAKIGAIAPFMQNQNLQAAADREQGFKSEIAANQSKIDAAKAAQARADQHDIDMFNMRNNADVAAASAKAGSEATSKITLPQLIGMASAQQKTPAGKIQMDTGNILGQVKGGENIGAANMANLAGQIGRGGGVDEAKLSGLNEPGFLQGLAKDLGGGGKAPPVPQPPMFDKNWLTNSFRLDGKKITGTRADEVLRAPELVAAQQFIPQITSLKMDPRSGRVIEKIGSGEDAIDVIGYTPREVFDLWLDAQPGIKTMKTALKDYYGPYLDQLGKV